MKECRECDLAAYCYTESNTWVFRTKEEMTEKRAAIEACPLHRAAQNTESPSKKQQGLNRTSSD